MISLKGLGLSFQESMSGWVGVGQTDTSEGLIVGKRENTLCGFDLEIDIDDLSQFLSLTEHNASLKGTFTYEPLGGTFDISDGMFNLFSVDATTGMRKMIYAFPFIAKDGKTYYFHGHKEIKDDREPFDVKHDMTTLFSRIYLGENDQAPVYAAGEIYFDLSDAPSLVNSIKITGATWPWEKVAEFTAFMSFAFGKPEIQLIGDPNPYRPWLNVPPAVTLFAQGMDLNHYFGNLIYMAGSYMDESHFTHKDRNQFMTTLREAIKPLQELIFLQPGGKISSGAKALSRIFAALGD